MNVTARSGRLFLSEAGLILFHVIVNAPQTGVGLGPPLGCLPAGIVIPADRLVNDGNRPAAGDAGRFPWQSRLVPALCELCHLALRFLLLSK
jgi:hypothetical protein